MMAGTFVQSAQLAKPVQSPASALVVARARNRTVPKRKPCVPIAARDGWFSAGGDEGL
jgi:hypothetical protein